MKKFRWLFIVFFILVFKYSFSQDSLLIYDVATMSVTTHLLPAYDSNTPSDSTDPYFGIYGATNIPDVAPAVTYPNTEISLIQKAPIIIALLISHLLLLP